MTRLFIILCAFAVVFSCKTPEPRAPQSISSGSFVQESIARNKALIKEQEQLILDAIAKDSIANFSASEQGFWFVKTVVDTINNGVRPKFGDQLLFDYQIEDLSRNIIYSKEELSPRSYAMDQQELISGLREGLKMMSVGETMILYLPAHKAYGYYGDQNRIGTNVPLRIMVQLNQLEKNTIKN